MGPAPALSRAGRPRSTADVVRPGRLRFAAREVPIAMSVLLVLCTCPDPATAAALARALVEERLAACVNQVPGLRSTYRWQGQVREDAEVLLLAKTTDAGFTALRDRLVALHPYELPEVIAVKVEAGLAGYLAWVEEETTGAPGGRASPTAP